MLRYDVINHLIRKHGYKSFLEIGTESGMTFKRIKAERKVSVDPDASATYRVTSDEFFASNVEFFDIVFVDGLHHADQVTRDIEGAMSFLNEGGSIVLHDCNPSNEAMQRVPRVQQVWTGDVWKAFVPFLYANYKKYNIYTVDTDYGCGVIEPGVGKRGMKMPDDADYEWLDKNRQKALNLISVQEFKEMQ